MSRFQEIGRWGREGEGGKMAGWRAFFWVTFVKSRNEIYCRLAQTERKLPVHRAVCAREDADSSSLVPPVCAKCQLTPDTVLYVCVFAVCVRCPCVHFQGWTALLLAVENGHKAVIETLLGHDGINVNYANSKYMKNGHFWSLPYTGCFDDRATRPRFSFDFSH